MAELTPIVDAASFYASIKENRLLSRSEDAEAILVLEKEFETRLQASRDASLSEEKKNAFLFFQGALLGMMIAYRQVRHHYQETARAQGEPLTAKEH